VDDLRHYLDRHPGGGPALPELLGVIWADLQGDDLAMKAHKLGRIESPSWEAPILEFEIERHGGTVLGSKRAEMQRWVVDLDAMTKQASASGRRQLRPNAARLDVSPMAQELAEAIGASVEHPGVQWTADGLRFRLLPSRILPSGPKQTFESRAKRLRAALAANLAKDGWEPAPGGWFERPELARQTRSAAAAQGESRLK